MFIKRLLVRCPLSLKTEFAAPDRDFELLNGQTYLNTLYIDRANYACEKTYSGNTSTRDHSLSTVQLKAYFKVTEIKVADARSH